MTFAGRPGVLRDSRGASEPTTVETLRGPAGHREAAQAWLRPDSSNLQAALQLSYGLHAPDTLRRAVLFTDGNQTEGDVTSEALSARRRGVRVGYFPLAAEEAAEVLVRDLRLLSDTTEATQIRSGRRLLEGEIIPASPSASAPPCIRAAFLASAKTRAMAIAILIIGWSQPGALPQPDRQRRRHQLSPAAWRRAGPLRGPLCQQQSGALAAVRARSAAHPLHRGRKRCEELSKRRR